MRCEVEAVDKITKNLHFSKTLCWHKQNIDKTKTRNIQVEPPLPKPLYRKLTVPLLEQH